MILAILAYDMRQEKLVVLRPYMRWVPHVLTRNITDEQWEVALKLSVTEAEYQKIIEGRKKK